MDESMKAVKMFEDKESDFLMLGFAIDEDPSTGERKLVGLGMLRNGKDVMCSHYMKTSTAKQARRTTVRAALELNITQMRNIVKKAKQIAKLYDEHEICLFNEDGIDSSLVSISDHGVADLNNWENCTNKNE
jgi:hypothetical protein